MSVFTKPALGNELRRMCDSVNRRLWIASPFVGSWSIRAVLGRAWWDRAGIDVRLLTDPDEQQINRDTALRFAEKGKIKKLRGLHAKLFIVDDEVLLTSANLTYSAFARRHEVGTILTGHPAQTAIELFSKWWELAEVVSKDTVLGLPRKQLDSAGEDGKSDLPEPTPLPPDPGNFGGQRFISLFKDYPEFLECYRNMVEVYESLPRIWPSLPIYLETDALMDYLYHHDGEPSKPFASLPPRKLTRQQRETEIRKYASLFQSSPRASETNGIDRLRDQQWIRNILSPVNISSLDKRKIAEVASTLNCMGDKRVLNRFLNHPQNTPRNIRKSWSALLHSPNIPPTEEMTSCADSLFGFKRSSVQELLGWYRPDEFPLRNRNVNAGLRFLGYEVRPD